MITDIVTYRNYRMVFIVIRWFVSYIFFRIEFYFYRIICSNILNSSDKLSETTFTSNRTIQ